MSFALEVLEEGGELVTMSVVVAGAVALASSRRPPASEPVPPRLGTEAGEARG